MRTALVSSAQRSGLAKKPYSAGLGILAIISTVFCILSAAFLAIDLLGYHAPGRPPHPEISVLLLALGLCLATVGQLLGGGRNEGIRVRGLAGIIDVLLIRLALAGAVFILLVLKVALRGKQIHLYPVGVLMIISGFFCASRLVAKYAFYMDRRNHS
jgi:hypothetical protein